MKVLVVEDDWLIAEVVKDELTQAGFSVIGPAPSRTAALRMAALEAPSVALVDVELQGKADGFVVAAELVRRGIPVIFTTGRPESVPIDHYGAVGLIVKPYSFSDLPRAVLFVVGAATHGAQPIELPSCLRLARNVRRSADGRILARGSFQGEWDEGLKAQARSAR